MRPETVAESGRFPRAVWPTDDGKRQLGGALEVCRDWIQQVAEEITRKGTENTEVTGDAAEITSQYTHYTHKTKGKYFNP